MIVTLIAVGIGIFCWFLIILKSSIQKYMFRLKSKANPAAVNHSFLVNYNKYELSFREKAITIVVTASMIFMIGYIFYNQIAIALICSLSSIYFLRIRQRQLLLRRKTELNDQFKQALFSISSSLSAGRSLENAITETVQDLQMLYANPQTYIIVEFNIIIQKLRNGENVEAALRQFSERAGLEDIRNFSEVLSICKRSGGNLVEVIRRTAGMISEKIELQQDISLLVAQKRFESRILSFAPLVIVAFLSFSSPDYMQPLYEGYLGKFIMTVALAGLIFCFTITNKIMNIQVQTQ